MTTVFRRFGSRIKNKLALLSAIPVAVVTLVITWHTIETSREQINSFQLHTATQLAKNLATISDFALYSNRKDLLEPLVESASDIPVIADIVYLTPDRTLLLDKQLPATVTADMLLNSDYSHIAAPLFVVEEPVYLIDVDISDFDGDTPGEKTLLGWVVVIADNTSALNNIQENIITQLLISFTVLLGAILLSYLLSNNVVSPITRMTETVRELERGNLKARITPTTGDELAILANGINHLAKAVAEGRDNLETKIELATERLRKTLEDLQKNNRDLDVARTEAENANAAKSEFLAQMSHELRTPITAIQGFVNLLNGSELQPSQRRYCTIIQQASKQLLQLIDDILDFTRLQSNAVELDGSPFNLAECVETPLSLMASNAHKKGLELVLDISPNVPYELIGDSLRLRQIIYNLISNAIKFTPSGHVCLAVASRPLNEDKIQLILQISDTGIGIRDKDQARLFEAFSQADNSISRRFGGSGLGLSIVKRLVTLMKGRLQLESTTGKGSCFTIELPFSMQRGANAAGPAPYSALLFDAYPTSRQALEHRLSRFASIIESCEDFSDLEISDSNRAPNVIIYSAPIHYLPQRLEQDIARLRHLYASPIVVLAPATSAYRELDGRIIDRLQPVTIIDKPPLSADLERLFTQPSDAAPEQPQCLSEKLKAHILIAEDNEFTRILLAAFFEGSQCQLVMAVNGQEAIDQCSHQHFDLVLMDVHMPEVNGLTALQVIRQEDGPNRRTPVIMLTADILQQEENALFDAGASDLVFKPLNEAKLISTIQKHLNNTQLAMPTRAVDSSPKNDEQRRLFREEIARLSTLAKVSLSGKNEESLRDAIHQLLGIAGVYHMTHLERAVQALHQAIKSGSGNTMFAAMETLEHEVEQLLQVEESPTS